MNERLKQINMKPDKQKEMGVKVIKTETSGTKFIPPSLNEPEWVFPNAKDHAEFYGKVVELVHTTPNDMDLGKEVRRLISRYDNFVYPSIH